MLVDFYGLSFQTPRVSVYLWSPWRASALEHKLFDVVRQLPGLKAEMEHGDEARVDISDAKVFKQALHSACRALKGWQEEATDAGHERRGWRWLFEGDTDDHGYDHMGDQACIWAFLRLTIERGGVDEGTPPEDIDMNGFGMRIWPIRDNA